MGRHQNMAARRISLATLVLGAIALLVPPALAGGQLPKMELADFAQTKAKSFNDLAGRTILIEFFAYW